MGPVPFAVDLVLCQDEGTLSAKLYHCYVTNVRPTPYNGSSVR